jgi:hypothetical protein
VRIVLRFPLLRLGPVIVRKVLACVIKTIAAHYHLYRHVADGTNVRNKGPTSGRLVVASASTTTKTNTAATAAASSQIVRIKGRLSNSPMSTDHYPAPSRA